MEDYFNLKRFIEAQNNFNDYETALQEVKDGWKQTHWIWYIFPQMKGLGHSSMSNEYGISSLLEAKAYYEEPTLRRRLLEITEALYQHNGSLSPADIFGETDAMKVKSCMTLFDIICPHSVFSDVLRDFYDEERCETSIRMTRGELETYMERYPMRIFHINGKSLFECGSFEADQIGEEAAIATLLDIRSRGYSIEDTVKGYLYETDLTAYRTGGMESTLALYVKNFALDAFGATENKEIRNVIRRILGDSDPFELALPDLARLLDTLLYELLHLPSLEKFVTQKKEKTLIRENKAYQDYPDFTA